MNSWITYAIITAILLVLELAYFKIADRCNIIDKPNERSSHSTIVLRGGGIIFPISMVVWMVLGIVLETFGTSDISRAQGFNGISVQEYLPFLVGLVLIAGVSFYDDIHSLPDSVRLVTQFVAMALMFWNLDILHWEMWWVVLLAFIVFVGATNIINFMDGINGITAGYAFAVLIPLLLLDVSSFRFHVPSRIGELANFIEPSYLVVAIIGVLVFCIFNFRPKGKAKCFAGDVGSIGIAFVLLFAIGRLILRTGDVTYLILLLVYGVDGCLTIIHRIMLHENLGEAHRKHAYQIMANELKVGHVKVSLLYMALQLIVSLGFILLCPNNILAHWIYFVGAIIALSGAYVLFMKKYYHLHQEYLDSLNKVKN